MLFNSYSYILLFLPITFFVYYALNKWHYVLAGRAFLVMASLFFYSWWNPLYLPFLLFSILVNYAIGTALLNEKEGRIKPKFLLIFGIMLNLGFLGYFKYADFFISNVNILFKTNFNLLKIVLPLAISFFTFQQIAYLADSYKKETKEYDFLNYSLFVCFFPQLIAGPIVHHMEMMPQFANKRNLIKNYKNIALGFFIFSLGLFKKSVIADYFANFANNGYEAANTLNFVEGWVTSLSYTFQLYFDFSGYTDMAIGSALLFNIKLPLNFNSPYKALNIQDFWRRWHMTLSRWLKDYLYIPLGGNRKGRVRGYMNLFITFLLGGLWHGAAWTFVVWGAMHGFATVLYKVWHSLGFKLPKLIAWFITFMFINITWIFFRADNLTQAKSILKAMLGMQGFRVPRKLGFLADVFPKIDVQVGDMLGNIYKNSPLNVFLIFFAIFIIVFILNNSNELKEKFKPTIKYQIFNSIVLVVGLMSLVKVSEFLYFNF
ncbi:MAG: MBOAT family protein [Alphaproteobacteria bacterium]